MRLLLFVVALSASLHAQQSPTFRGSVASIASAHPIARAEVRLVYVDSVKAENLFLDSARTRVAVTDSAGAFAIRNVTPGHYWVNVHRIGYQPFEGMLTLDTTTVEIELALDPAVAQLPELRVNESASNRVTDRLDKVGFTRRSREGAALRVHGHQEIVDKRALKMESLLEGWGFQPSDKFLLDGMPTEWRDLIEYPVELIAGIEEYRSVAMAPVEFTRTLPGRQTFTDKAPTPPSSVLVVQQPRTAGMTFTPPQTDKGTPIRSHFVLIWTYFP